MKILLPLAIISLLFIVGCQPQSTTTQQPYTQQVVQSTPVPTITPIPTPTPTPEPTIPSNYAEVRRVPLGLRYAYLIYQDKELTMVNCGNRVYSDILLDNLNDFHRRYYFDRVRVVITNTSSEDIGGCEAVMMGMVIDSLDIYDKPTYTEEYDGLIRWVSPYKVHVNYPYDTYYLNVDGIKLDESKINGTVWTNGVDYITP